MKTFLCISSFFICLFAEAKDPLDYATISLYAVHIPTGKVLIDENSQKSLIPASTMKIVTTAAALHVLGPETQFQTDLAYDGEIKEGVLHGNLYVIGGGDPCLGSDRTSSSLSWKNQIEAWVLSVQNLGIQEIKGKVVGDASKWEKALAVPDWSFEDLGNYYGAGACALSFHENAYSLVFKPGESEGSNASILKTDPFLSDLEIHNEVKTGPIGSGDRACVYGMEFSSVQYVRGTIPAGVLEFSIKGAIPNPPLACAQLLEKGLFDKGIFVRSEKVVEGEKKRFYITVSPKVSEIVRFVNQYSINLYAEHLLKKMGEMSQGEGSTLAGIKVVEQFLKQKKIDQMGMRIADGSGLSKRNLITAQQLVALLLEMKKSEFYSLFLDSLPEVRDGVRAKSGTMSLVRGCVGYAKDVAFAILINQCVDSKRSKEKIDDFLFFILENSK